MLNIVRVISIGFALTVLMGAAQFSGPKIGSNGAASTINPQVPKPLNVADTEKVVEAISTSEWLGPLAPIALSPFFGITCLSGMSIFGEGTFLAENRFVASNPVLQNQTVFWSFLVLTLLTSLPRLTKVSKPLAQVLDQVETYAGLITLVVIRIAATGWIGETPAPEFTSDGTPIVQMGFFSFSVDVLLMAAAALNVFVINMVKFFFEALVWLTPFPFVDAIFEGCNKLLCVSLMAIYAWSPLVATIINLTLFIACAIVFRFVYRRVVYMRTLLTDPVWKMINKRYGEFGSKSQLIVFPQNEIGPFPAKARLVLSAEEGGWTMTHRSLPFLPERSQFLTRESTKIELRPGLLLNKLVLSGEFEGQLIFSRRYSGDWERVIEKMGLQFKQTTNSNSVDGKNQLGPEWA